MEDALILNNFKQYIDKLVSGWRIVAFDEMPAVYIIVLTKDNLERIFYIRRPIIRGNDVYRDEDLYELWYKDYEEAKLLSISEVSNIDFLLTTIEKLLEKYSKHD
jgi:hypothetical protein